MYRYSAFDVACHIVNSSIDAGKPISNLQLQKTLYFVQVGYCESTGELLFGDDFQAWQYGPVIPEVYRLFSIWGGGKITTRIMNQAQDISPEDRAVIDPIVDDCRNQEPWALVERAHAKGSPWWVTIHKFGDRGIISQELICQAAG